MRTLVTLLVVLTVAIAGPAMAVVVVNDDFESGYSDGSVEGQTAANGEVWASANEGPPSFGAAFGVGGSGGLRGDGGGRNHNGVILPLGRTVQQSDDQHILIARVDVLAAPVNSGNIFEAAELYFFESADSRMQVGYINNWDPQNHQGHFRFGGGVVNGGAAIGSWPDYDEGWFQIAAEVNLRTGQADFSWHDLDTPTTSGASSYTYDASTIDFRPDSVQIRLEHWDAAGFNGLDNLFVEVIPEPASLALLSLGGLAMLRRRR